MNKTTARETARLRAMEAIAALLPADNSGKMKERAVKGYIELLETQLSAMEDSLNWIKQNTNSDEIFSVANNALKLR